MRNNLIDYDMRHGYRGGAPLWQKNEAAWDDERIQRFYVNCQILTHLFQLQWLEWQKVVRIYY